MPDPLTRATAYPFGIPDGSYLFREGRAHPFDAEDGLFDGRTPVIACGSNRSPEQLARKYAAAGEAVIPVQRAWLPHFDVVYAAHITSYGSIAATLQRVPDMRVEVSVIWLTIEQLEVMHATEGNYDYVAFDDLALDADGGPAVDRAFAYIAVNGCLSLDGQVIGLEAARAESRPHAAYAQMAAQRHVQTLLGDDGPLDDFILENIADPELRTARNARLGECAVPFAAKGGGRD